MKKLTFILFLLPVFCFAQTENSTLPKPSTDDCPSWKKPKNSGKAEYFQFLRSGKPAKGQQVNGVYYPGAIQQANTRTQTQKAEQNPFLVPKRERRVNQTIPTKNTELVKEKEEEKIQETQPEEALNQVKEEPVVISSVPKEEERAEVLVNNDNPKTEKNIKDKPKKENKPKKRSVNTSLKKARDCKSGGSDKCPSF